MHPPRLARLQGGLAIGAFALFLLTALPQAVSRAAGMLSFAQSTGAESFAAARARFSGPAYVAAVDAIRQALPPDQPYFLVEAGRPQDGDTYWVRFDLAPRPAIYLGQIEELTDVRSLRRRLGKVRQVVVAYGPGKPPRLYERYRFVQEIERADSDAPEPPDPRDPRDPSGQRPLHHPQRIPRDPRDPRDPSDPGDPGDPGDGGDPGNGGAAPARPPGL
jgi:hypothetical protein